MVTFPIQNRHFWDIPCVPKRQMDPARWNRVRRGAWFDDMFVLRCSKYLSILYWIFLYDSLTSVFFWFGRVVHPVRRDGSGTVELSTSSEIRFCPQVDQQLLIFMGRPRRRYDLNRPEIGSLPIGSLSYDVIWIHSSWLVSWTLNIDIPSTTQARSPALRKPGRYPVTSRRWTFQHSQLDDLPLCCCFLK